MPHASNIDTPQHWTLLVHLSRRNTNRKDPKSDGNFEMIGNIPLKLHCLAKLPKPHYMCIC